MKTASNPIPDGPSFSRRTALGAIVGVGAAALLAACGSDSKTASTSSATGNTAGSTSASTTASSTASTTGSTTGSVTGSAAAGSLTAIPEETGGPFPGDGSNGPNVLTQQGVVRKDITSSFGSSTTVAEGVPLTMQFTVTDASTGSPMNGAAVYVWHCNRDGEYSMYGQGVQGENYLRGVQVADANGAVEFDTIFPAAYSGRWPHVHIEIYANVDDATSAGSPLRTTQMAMPKEICDQVYSTADGYQQSVTNLQRTSLSTDMVFGDDDGVHELATISGSLPSGLVATLPLPI